MRKLAVLAIALAPAVAGAEYTIEKGTSWDCSKDPVVRLGGGKQKIKFTGQCKTIRVDHNKNVLDIESVDELHVGGTVNTIDVGTVGAIDFRGDKNVVRWKKVKTGDKPAVRDKGRGNAVLQAK